MAEELLDVDLETVREILQGYGDGTVVVLITASRSEVTFAPDNSDFPNVRFWNEEIAGRLKDFASLRVSAPRLLEALPAESP
jgi:hypothetical protein